MFKLLITTLAILVFSTMTLADSPPNVLLILVDDLGYGDLSSYGAPDAKTPHVDRLIASGMRFNNFYANSCVCSPTRAALMTGRYPDLVGVPGVIRETSMTNNWGYLRPDAVTLPQVLKTAGYRTALIGKWHLGRTPENLPNARGFDHFYGFLEGMVHDYWTFEQFATKGEADLFENNQRVTPPGDHATDLFSDKASQFITHQANADKPWFLYLAYNAPHSPVQPPEDWLKQVQQREPQLDEKRAKMVAFVEHLDHGIGRVLQTLQDSGQNDNTLVIFTSDNGGSIHFGSLNGELRGGKQDMYEGGIRVPFAAAWPGKIIPESKSETMGITMDLFPTIAEAAGVTFDHAIDGISLLPAFRGHDQDLSQRTLMFMRREGGNVYMGDMIWAVRRGDWKLLQNTPTQPFEFFNLAKDSAEQTDLAQRGGRVYNELAASLRSHIQRSGKVPWFKP